MITNFLFLLNALCVLLYGLALSFAFAGLTPKAAPKLYALSVLALLLVQTAAYLAFGTLAAEKLYPLVVHLPIVCLLYFFGRRSWLASVVCVVLAYLLCTPRLWVGNVVSALFGYGQGVSYLVQCLATPLLLWLALRFLAPHVITLLRQGAKVLWLFVSMPLLYYVFALYLTVYSNWYYGAGPLLLAFMDAALVLMYVVFFIFLCKAIQERQALEDYYQVSELMNKQAQAELSNLRTAQEKDAVYRHDLRHHLAYLHTAISSQKAADALEYIAQISQQLDEAVVKRYCTNENVNLILSSYLAQAAQAQIATEVVVESVDFAGFASIDLCSLLANALENATCASGALPDPADRFLHLRIFHKGQHLCIDLQNSYAISPVLQGGIPTTNRQMHGLGVKSMVDIVEKYGGTYVFETRGNAFVFQALLPQCIK